MTIEEDVFKRYSPDFKKLEEYGFKKEAIEEGGPKEAAGGQKTKFVFETVFKDGLFKALVCVSSDGKVSGTVYDLENDDEFLPLRTGSGGAFVGEVRAAYEGILLNIREKCFTREYFVFPQTNRIANLVIEKYGDAPEFLWEKFTGTGVFRNPESEKWYLIILDVERSKVTGAFKAPSKGVSKGVKDTAKGGAKGKDIVEVMDVKLSPEHIENLLQKEGFYPGYHMNKKSWLTVILDESVSDEKIMRLIEESHSFTEKKAKGKK